MKKQFIYILLGIIIGIVLLWSGFTWIKKTFFNPAALAKTEIIHLKVKPITAQDITINREYIGYVEAIHQVQIVPYISGYLKDILITPGQMVKQGEPLVTINDAEYKAKLDAAEANVQQEKSSLEYNKNYYERVQKSGKRAFSQTEIDNAKNNFQQAEAQLKNALANEEFARINYNYTKINAPISGLIGNFTLSSGDYVAPQASYLLNIVQINPIRVVFSLTDKEYLEFTEDKNSFSNTVIKLKMANGSLYEYNGEFKYTDNQINKQTNTIAVYAYFKNDKNKLLPNEFVTVEVFKLFKDSVLIDKDLVVMRPDGNFVMIYRNGLPSNVSVQIISETDKFYVVKNTFNKDDLIILTPNSVPPTFNSSDVKTEK